MSEAYTNMVCFCNQESLCGACMYVHEVASPAETPEYMFSLLIAQICKQEEQQLYPLH